MTHPRDYQTPAIVVRKTNLGEADRILTFFSPELGKIQGVVKGVRKPKSKMAGHLEFLTHSIVSFSRGKGAIDTISGAQTVDGFLPLKSDLHLSACGLYATELVNQFTMEHQENEPLFELFLETLKRLCEAENKDLVLRFFEMQLLNEAGYQPELRNCTVCHQPLQPVPNWFSSLAGGMLCPDCRIAQPDVSEVPVNLLKVLRLLQNGDYSTVSRLKLDAELSRQLQKIVRDYLRFILERDLKSADWLDEMREF